MELTVQDDLRVEGPEAMHVVIVTDSRVTTRSQGVAAVTLLDNDNETQYRVFSLGLQISEP